MSNVQAYNVNGMMIPDAVAGRQHHNWKVHGIDVWIHNTEWEEEEWTSLTMTPYLPSVEKVGRVNVDDHRPIQGFMVIPAAVPVVDRNAWVGTVNASGTKSMHAPRGSFLDTSGVNDHAGWVGCPPSWLLVPLQISLAEASPGSIPPPSHLAPAMEWFGTFLCAFFLDHHHVCRTAKPGGTRCPGAIVSPVNGMCVACFLRGPIFFPRRFESSGQRPELWIPLR